MSEAQRRSTEAERRRAPETPRPFGRRVADRVELTARQQEVLRLVAEGLENKEIAARLAISEQGVKQQVSVLLRKFKAPSRAILARSALAMRLFGSSVAFAEVPFEYLFDRAPILISVTRGPEHRFVLVNRAYVELFGERDYVGRTYRECFPEASAESLEQLDRLYATGETFSSSERRREILLSNGERREVYLSLVAQPTREPDGSVGGMIFFGRDVTHEVELRRQIHRLTVEQRTLVEQLPVGVIYTDERAHPVLVNAVAQRILGGTFDPERPLYMQLEDWNVRLAATGERVDSTSAPSARAIAGWPFDDEVLVGTNEGTKVIHVSARPLHEQGGGISGALLILTERTSAGVPADRTVDTVPEERGPSGGA